LPSTSPAEASRTTAMTTRTITRTMRCADYRAGATEPKAKRVLAPGYSMAGVGVPIRSLTTLEAPPGCIVTP